MGQIGNGHVHQMTWCLTGDGSRRVVYYAANDGVLSVVGQLSLGNCCIKTVSSTLLLLLAKRGRGYERARLDAIGFEG